LQIFPIASSSDGNSTFIRTASASILVDCGVSLKLLLDALGKDQLMSLDAIFITHEHYDHIKGLDTLARKFDLPVYINQLSYEAKSYQFRNIDNHVLERGVAVSINDLTVVPFDVEHDTVNTFGFTMTEENGPLLCYFTDTGLISEYNKSLMTQADVLLIECNYNEDMLLKYPDYPDDLKGRIADYHLSNRQSLDALEEIGVESFGTIIPAHLSPRTNSPEQLIIELTERFPDDIDKFAIAPLSSPIRVEKRCFNSLES